MLTNVSIKPKLFFHIGMPRTGTTSVQKCLTDHLDGHPEYELLYFEVARDQEGIGHHLLSSRILSEPETLLQDLLHEHRVRTLNNKVGACILSSEGVWEMLSSPYAFEKFQVFYRQLIEHFDVVLIACLRDPNESIISMYKHQIVFGEYKKSSLEYLTNYMHDFYILSGNLLALIKFSSQIIFLNYHPSIAKDIVTILTGGLVRNPIVSFTPSPDQSTALLMAAYKNFNIELPTDFKNVLCFDKTLKAFVDNFINSFFVVPDEVRMWGDVANFYYEKEIFENNIFRFIKDVDDFSNDCNVRIFLLCNQLSQFAQNHLNNINYSLFLEDYKRYLTSVDLKNELQLLRWTDAIFPRITSIVGIEYLDFREALKFKIRSLIEQENT